MTSLSVSHRVWSDAIGPVPKLMVAATAFFSISAALGSVVGIFYYKSILIGIVRGSGYPLSVLAIAYWAMFISGAAAQNKPANACLVPGLTRRLRHTAVLTWLLTMVPLAGVSYAHPQGWVLLLTASVGVTAFGLYRAGCESFLALALLTIIVYVWPPSHPYLSDAVLAAACAISLLFAAWALRRSFPQGGERHFAMLDKHAKAMASDRLDTSNEQARRGGKRRPVYDFVLRRDVATKNRGALLLHALGPSTHRLTYVLPIVALALAIMVATKVAHTLGFAPKMDDVTRRIFGALFGVVPVLWFRFVTAIRRAGGEQALARLAPGLPRAHDLNRQLGIQILTTCFLEWLAVAVLALGWLVLWDAPPLSFMVTPAFLVAMLPLLSLGLGDYSGASSYFFAWPVSAAVVCFAIAFSTVFSSDANVLAWPASMATIVVLACACIWSRWRVMMAAPPAFPAGRGA